MEDFFFVETVLKHSFEAVPPRLFYLCNKQELYVKLCDLLYSFVLSENISLSADHQFELRFYLTHFLVAVLIGWDFSELENFFFFSSTPLLNLWALNLFFSCFMSPIFLQAYENYQDKSS